MTQHSRDTPQFYLTAPSPCPYLPDRSERKVFTHLVGEKAGELNDLLTHGGFRRSQSIAYRPACDQCRACISVRVIADEFRPSRSTRRVLSRNADIVGNLRAAMPTSEQYCCGFVALRSPRSLRLPICTIARPAKCSSRRSDSYRSRQWRNWRRRSSAAYFGAAPRRAAPLLG